MERREFLTWMGIAAVNTVALGDLGVTLYQGQSKEKALKATKPANREEKAKIASDIDRNARQTMNRGLRDSGGAVLGTGAIIAAHLIVTR